MPQKGEYTHLVKFLWLNSIYKFVLFGVCSSKVLGGLLRKTAVSGAMSGSRAENICCCFYCCKGVQKTGTWLGPPKPNRKYTAKREISTCRGDLSAVFTMCYANVHAAIMESTCTELAERPWFTGGA